MEAAKVVWGRFLEADNASEVLMGISKGLIGRLQVTEFNLNGFTQRENDLKSKVQNLIEQPIAKDAALEKLERSHVENIKENSAEVQALKKRVSFFEEERKDFEHRMNVVIAENESCQEQLIEMENFDSCPDNDNEDEDEEKAPLPTRELEQRPPSP
ncbi:hypothetical protein RIF29_38989 [Crotalaria pallida]|uniref:Uncharacterized protein n=1 Tax=Crotalaria pallida TaxID=3830 RepID=A0AAN9HPE7_CROPI